MLVYSQLSTKLSVNLTLGACTSYKDAANPCTVVALKATWTGVVLGVEMRVCNSTVGLNVGQSALL